MAKRINRAIELLEQGQPVYYTGTSQVSCEAGVEMAGTWAVGPGDMHMSFGIPAATQPYSDELMAVRSKVKSACDAAGLFFLDGASKEDVAERIDEGVMIISGRSAEEGAQVGRAHSKRTMPT